MSNHMTNRTQENILNIHENTVEIAIFFEDLKTLLAI